MRREEKRAKRGKAAKREAVGSSAGAAEGESFRVDVRDPRFERLFTSADFHIDPTHPKFKRTSEATALLDEVRTYFCSWSVAGVTVRTLHSNLYNPTAIRAAARILLNRSGYASDKLPGVDKPYPVFLEGVARLLVTADESVHLVR